MVAMMPPVHIPSINELQSLDHDTQHALLCQWARDAKVHEIEQNGSLGRIEKKVNTLQVLVIANIVFLAIQFPEEIRTWVSLLKSLF
jgi:hypothetical protein